MGIKKIGNLVIHLIPSLLLIYLGILVFAQNMIPLQLFYILLLVYVIGRIITRGVTVLVFREKARWLSIVVDILSLIILLAKPQWLSTLFITLLGDYLILYSIVLFVDYYALRKNNDSSAITTLFIALAALLIGIGAVLIRSSSLAVLTLLIGGYLIVKGLSDCIRLIVNWLNKEHHKDIRFRFSISLPVMLNALLPIRMYASFSHLMKLHYLDRSAIKEQSDDCLEILVHLNNHGFEQLGHVDVAYKNMIYSYGAHDPESREVFGSIGRGVLLIVDRERFINFCIDNDELIAVYTLPINEQQQKQFEGRLAELLKDTANYDCMAKREIIAGKQIQAHDYSSRVYLSTQADMRIFTQGKFKIYYVFSTNCVLLADYLLRSDQFRLIQLSGLITPGAYLNYLQQELNSRDGYVTNLDIYCKKMI